jgi:hypothetical protein
LYLFTFHVNAIHIHGVTFSANAWPDSGILSRRPRIFSVLPLQTNLREKILTLQRDDDWYKEVEAFVGQNAMMVPRLRDLPLTAMGY